MAVDVDPYKVLGLGRDASKEEIKRAFRRLAMKFHPDKHSRSAQAERDAATLRFKQLSEAYDVLSDDRKRAAFNLRSHTTPSAASGYGGGGSYGHYGAGSGYGRDYGYRYTHRASGSSSSKNAWEFALRFFTTRASLLNLAFAGVLLVGSALIDTSRETLWKMHNSGKSFEEAMEAMQKSTVHKDGT